MPPLPTDIDEVENWAGELARAPLAPPLVAAFTLIGKAAEGRELDHWLSDLRAVHSGTIGTTVDNA